MRDDEITEVDCRLYYNLEIIATENPLSNKNIKLYLCSHDGQGVNFKFFFIFLKIFRKIS